jgi:enediyne biosynthesis protein E7
MSSDVDAARVRKARRIPIHRALPPLLRDPLRALGEFTAAAEGEVVRLDLGLFRPYLVTHPDHVQRVFRDRSDIYVREGMFWEPLTRLFGRGILSDGPSWESSRANLQPLFTAKHVETLMGRMADAVADSVEALDRYARSGDTIDVTTEMSRIVYMTVIRVFFADRITPEQADRLVPALEMISTSLAFRMLLPFVPNAVPVPGDRSFRRAVRIIDDVLLPAIRASRREPGDGDDIIATLCRSYGPEGRALTEQQIRDDVVTMFVAATETTSVSLTWLWPVLEAHPQVAVRLYDEIDRLVGHRRVNSSHVPHLHYTRMVLDELLRLYPAGWILPRTAATADVIDGVEIKRGATLLVSPFLTQRMAAFWDRPLAFDPERFAPGRAEHRHRYAYFPFGGGPHQCIGKHVFLVEAQLIVAGILARFRPRMVSGLMPAPGVAGSLRPAGEVRMTLLPVQRTLAA